MEQFLALKASAGSGKTFSLSLRFIYLLFQGANPHQILALTFTKKASKEMYHRIYAHLKSLSTSFTQNTYENNDVYKALRENALPHSLIANQVHNVYYNFLQANPRITTIDSFFYSVLKKFCWYLGMSSRFETGEYESDTLYNRFLSLLSKEQIHDLGTFCFENETRLYDFLFLLESFYKQGFDETILHTSLDDIWTKYHLREIEEMIMVRMKQIHDFLLSQPKGHKKAPPQFQKDSIKSILKSEALFKWEEHSFLRNYNLTSLHPIREDILNLLYIYLCKKEAFVLEKLRGLLQVFRRAKDIQINSQQQLGFSDIMLKNYELLTRHMDWNFFYFRLDERITHILLDEFQDTSLMQYHILKPLMEEILSGEGRIANRSLFMVGDEKQGIYMFRGSFAGIFEEASKALKQDNLPYNYRSSKQVIDFNNKLFQIAFLQSDIQFIPQQYPPHSNIPEGYVRVFAPCEELDMFKEQVYKALKSLLNQGANEDSITILAFTNKDVQILKEYLNECDPSLAIVTDSSARLIAQKEVKILIYALRYIATYALQKEQTNEEQKQIYASCLNLYKKNMAKLLGKHYNEKFEIQSLQLAPTLTPSKIILNLIKELDLACENTLYFLELSIKFKDIQSFLDSLFNVAYNAPTQSNNGIKIMTIHKSKGLEFEHVILCDSFTQKRYSQDKLIYEYSGTYCKHIYYKIAYRDKIDRAYKNALMAHQQRIKQEELNVLYVAFTRAQIGLNIVQKHGGYFTTLNLTPIDEPLPLFNLAQSSKSSFKEPRAMLLESKNYGLQEDFIQQEHLQEITQQAWQNIYFGRALHSSFELILGYQMKQENLHTILYNRYGFALSAKDLQQASMYAQNCIQSKDFKNLIKGFELACEVSYITQGKIFRMDTLLWNKEGYIVLDYKSSNIYQDNTDTFQAQKKQVQGYMRFLDSLLQKNKTPQYLPTRGFIIYPLQKEGQRICEVSASEP